MHKLSAVEVPLKQGSPEWHDWRRQGIGGSDAAVINGTSPYKTIHTLSREKAGQPIVTDEDDSKEFIFAKGHKTEALIRAQFSERLNVDIKPACFQHPKIPYFRASLDGFNSKHGVLEAKLVGKAVLMNASKGEIPKHHFTQMQHQLFVTGADIGNWFGHDGKKHGVVVPIRADIEFMKQLEELEHRFWEDVQNKRFPPLSDRDYLIPKDQQLLEELRDAKELEANAKAHYEALKEKAIKMYKHSKIAGGGVKLFKVVRSGTINLKSIPEISQALQRLDAGYLEKFRTEGSESWSIKIDAKKGAFNENRNN